jgi:hypothetical protein
MIRRSRLAAAKVSCAKQESWEAFGGSAIHRVGLTLFHSGNCE